MAPEVIQESYYDGKADVWSLGISAIEMAELLPPNSTVHPMRVLFKILRDPPPALKEKGRWSRTFHDFLGKCLAKEPETRLTASALLQVRNQCLFFFFL
jgi:serine/threonine protein kinase